ncbi:hypothetical protein DW223_01435 [Butyricicoccus sp. AM18-35]|nr:S-layer homology domain-containing protein [Butyricicoccus sp. AM18-35]RHO18184.1 hypothetical protein DW223_01435 [Butyricicoccus sp. AM18-35]
MMKTGKNNRFLAGILAASMMLTMSPFAFAADETEQKEMTTQEQVQSAPKNETNANPTVSQTDGQSSGDTNSEAPKTEDQSPKDTNSEGGQPSKDVNPAGKDTTAGGSTSTSKTPAEPEKPTESETPTKPETPKSAAKIGEKAYPTVADAMAAAQPGDTIELLKDITESVKVEVTKNFGGELTIDLNQHSIDGNSQKCIWRTGSSNCWPQKLIVKKGTLKNAGPGSAIEWEGDLEVVNCRFEKNQGGAIQSRSGNTTIVNSTFEENQSGKAAGAAIQLAANVKCAITGSAFSGNVTNNMGGAVYVDHGTLDITDCTFEGNSAGFGGAIAVADVEKLTIGNNTNCLDNKATSCGGGIYAIRSTATFEPGSALRGNSSTYGGAIYVDTSNINIAENSELHNNTATYWGGAIYANASNINIAANSAVYNNTAENAGADLLFNRSTFTLPNAKDMSGDRILSSDKAEITGWYHDGWFKWNPAAKDGQGDFEQIDRWPAETADEYTPVANDSHAISLKAAHPLMYTLTYDVTGDLPEGYTAPAKQTLVKGSSYTVAEVPASVTGTKDGVNGTFTFVGWKDKDGKVLSGEQQLTADLTLHGVWTFTKKSSGGGGGGGSHKPTVTIPDDVPTGLNGDDHYAYIVGYPDSTVRPQNGITRAEVATIFFRLLTDETRNANSTKSNSYSDVAAGAWYNHAVSTLSAMGIVKGDSHGKFNPNAPITRAEFAAIAARFDDKANTTAVDFSDIASHWAKNEISAAANNGWINGYTDGTFRPNNKITRAEAMTLVNRVLKRLPETAEDLHNDMIKWSDNSDTSAWYYLAVQEATNSHYYDLKENKHEKWSKLRETRDWTELEK